jgi:hypothetical protein
MQSLRPRTRPIGQRPQSQIDQGGGQYDPVQQVVNGGAPIPVPDEQQGLCLFSDTGAHPIEDAVTMKIYNSAPRHYVSWSNERIVAQRWVFNRVNRRNFNYIARVCAEIEP